MEGFKPGDTVVHQFRGNGVFEEYDHIFSPSEAWVKFGDEPDAVRITTSLLRKGCEPVEDLTTRAYNDFITRLIGHVPSNPQDWEVPREYYTRTMAAVQQEYGLTQGHPEFLHFMLTMVGRSPKIIEGAGNNATEDNSRGAGE